MDRSYSSGSCSWLRRTPLKLAASFASRLNPASCESDVGRRTSGDIVKGAAIDPDALIRINSEARRVLGLLRSKSVKAKPAAPTILDYVDELAALSKYDRSSLDHRDITDDLLRSIPTLLFLQRNIWAKSSVERAPICSKF
jgi:hypothetical protein